MYAITIEQTKFLNTLAYALTLLIVFLASATRSVKAVKAVPTSFMLITIS